MEIGPALDGMNGPVPLPYSEIAAYEYVSGLVLTPFEASVIRLLSRAWCAESQAAREHDAPAPYIEAPSETARHAIAARLRDVLRGRIGPGGRGADPEPAK